MHDRIERLDWDSAFFGYEVGKLTIENIDSFDFTVFCQEKDKFKLIYLFSSKEISLVNFKLVDHKVIFSRKLIERPTAHLSPDITVKTLSSCQLDDRGRQNLIDLALESGIYSRFKTDTNFQNNEFIKLYKEWITSSIAGIAAFDLLLALKDNKIVGFITLVDKDDQIGEIGLIAVSDRCRGLGIGKALITAALETFFDKGLRTVQVVTQQDNIPAMGLYKACEFNLLQITHIYHFWNI